MIPSVVQGGLSSMRLAGVEEMIPEIEFRAAISKSGLTPPDQIMADGKIHRFASNGKRSDDSGWYVVFFDGIPAGAYGCWRTDLKGSWRANIGRPLTSAEEAAHQTKMDAARRERAREEARRHAEARDEARLIWKASKPAPSDHPYLVKKGVKAHGLRVHEGALIIPMRDGGELHSLQFIGPDGHKRFLPGGRVSGCHFSFGDVNGAAALCIICEGFATGASIHEATGHPVAVAFNAGNLLAVSKAMRKRFPELHLIVCGDDDAKTPGNPGRTKATEAAQAVGGLLVVPDFGPDRPDWASDLNDLAQLNGLGAVRRAITGNSDANQGDAAGLAVGATTPEPGLTDLGNAHRFARDHRRECALLLVVGPVARMERSLLVPRRDRRDRPACRGDDSPDVRGGCALIPGAPRSTR
jgi:putative DNA primase/helicase